MIDLELGPVIGKIGGQTEIITEEVAVGQKSSRTWELPEGWEAGYIGAWGNLSTYGYSASSREITIFGQTTGNLAQSGTQIGGFGELPASISTNDSSWTGTVTLIRTA